SEAGVRGSNSGLGARTPHGHRCRIAWVLPRFCGATPLVGSFCARSAERQPLGLGPPMGAPAPPERDAQRLATRRPRLPALPPWPSVPAPCLRGGETTLVDGRRCLCPSLRRGILHRRSSALHHGDTVQARRATEGARLQTVLSKTPMLGPSPGDG